MGSLGIYFLDLVAPISQTPVKVNIFQILTPVSYWLLIIMWTFILGFYLRRLRVSKLRLQLIGTLIVILSIDAFRTLFESIYFGAWYTSAMGLLPKGVHDYLVQPGNVFIPKAINVIAAALIISIVLRKWIPQEEDERNRQLAYTRDLEHQIRQRELAEAELKEHQEKLEDLVHERTEELAHANLLLIDEIGEKEKAQIELEKSLEKLRETLQSTVDAMSVIIENRDPYTFGHQKRVAQLSTAIGRRMGLTEDRIMGIQLAGLLHDLGKLEIPFEILNRPIQLGDLETRIIRNHPEVGYRILKGIDFPWPVATTVHQHHERMDGSGYPKGISGEEILLEARIVGVADVIESMASHRPYRPAKGLDVAMNEILSGKGIIYDTIVVETCIELLNEGFEFNKVEMAAL